MVEVAESDVIPGVWLVRLQALPDGRGSFTESYRASWLPEAPPMVQANRSASTPRVLRGLHYHRRQADLWYVQVGHVTTCLVDTRVASPAYGRHLLLRQGGEEQVALYIPAGVAHGFYAHDDVVMTYLVTVEYDGSDEFGVAWDDPELAIPWPDPAPLLSPRDQSNPRLQHLPHGQRVAFAG